MEDLFYRWQHICPVCRKSTYWSRLINGYVLTWTIEECHIFKQDLLTLPDNLMFPKIYVGVSVIPSFIYYVVICILSFVYLSFLFLTMSLSVCFKLMSLNIPFIVVPFVVNVREWVHIGSSGFIHLSYMQTDETTYKPDKLKSAQIY